MFSPFLSETPVFSCLPPSAKQTFKCQVRTELLSSVPANRGFCAFLLFFFFPPKEGAFSLRLSRTSVTRVFWLFLIFSELPNCYHGFFSLATPYFFPHSFPLLACVCLPHSFIPPPFVGAFFFFFAKRLGGCFRHEFTPIVLLNPPFFFFFLVPNDPGVLR